MTNISCKAANDSNTRCIARFGNAANGICYRKFAVREVFGGSLNIMQNLYKYVPTIKVSAAKLMRGVS